MGLKSWIVDKMLMRVLESKVSPVGWLNGYKTLIGTTLKGLGDIVAAVSGLLLGVQQIMCPGWTYCTHLEASILALATASAIIVRLSGLLVQLVGEWHSEVKEQRMEDERKLGPE